MRPSCHDSRGPEGATVDSPVSVAKTALISTAVYLQEKRLCRQPFPEWAGQSGNKKYMGLSIQKENMGRGLAIYSIPFPHSGSQMK